MLVRYCLLLVTAFAIVRSNVQEEPVFYANQVTVNGHPLVGDYFSLQTRGVMALVDKDPQALQYKPVLFHVTLRRSGTTVQQWPANNKDGVYSLQLDELWSAAQLGDELLVEPVGCSVPCKTYESGKRVLKLSQINWLFQKNNC